MKLNWKSARKEPPTKDGEYLVVERGLFGRKVRGCHYFKADGDKEFDRWKTLGYVKWYAEMPPLPKRLGIQE